MGGITRIGPGSIRNQSIYLLLRVSEREKDIYRRYRTTTGTDYCSNGHGFSSGYLERDRSSYSIEPLGDTVLGTQYRGESPRTAKMQTDKLMKPATTRSCS